MADPGVVEAAEIISPALFRSHASALLGSARDPKNPGKSKPERMPQVFPAAPAAGSPGKSDQPVLQTP